MPSPVPPALAAAALLCAALPAGAATEIAFRGANQNLEEAKKLVAKNSWEAALEELRTAEGLPGNSNDQLAQIAALRATALLAQPPAPESKQQADEALVQLWHLDPEGASLALASPAAQARAKALRAERPLVLHARMVTVRSGRPVLVVARLAAAPGAAQVVLHYRIEPDAADQSGSDAEYVAVALEQRRNGSYEAYLRPGIGGMPAGGEHVLRYFIDVRSPEGAVLDSNGSAGEPVRAQLSATKGEGPSQPTVLSTDEGGHSSRPPAPPPPGRPWYSRWEIVGPAAGALVVGGVIAAVLLHPKPQAQPGSLGKVDLP
jgi:hypothetical protein